MDKYYDFEKLQKLLDEKKEGDTITVGMKEDMSWTSKTLTQAIINLGYVAGIQYSYYATPVYSINNGEYIPCYIEKETV